MANKGRDGDGEIVQFTVTIKLQKYIQHRKNRDVGHGLCPAEINLVSQLFNIVSKNFTIHLTKKTDNGTNSLVFERDTLLIVQY